MTITEALVATRTEVPPVTAAQLDCACPPDPAAISAEMGRAFAVLSEFIGRNRLQPNAPPRAIYTAFGQEGVKLTVAMPVAAPAAPVPASGPVRLGLLPGAHTLRFTHRGPYRELMGTYGRITGWLKTEGLIDDDAGWVRFMPTWEEYQNDPRTTPEADLVTHIHLPMD